VTAPFNGAVTARKVSVGDYVGGSGTPTVLASIVQLDPIYINFSVNERDVITVSEEIKKRGDHARRSEEGSRRNWVADG
jgi:multidrug efflux pump subunit AcrA (membrane-fusion protein)